MANTVVQPSGLLTLVAAAEVMAQNKFSASQAIEIKPGDRSGEILGTTLYATGTALIQATGKLVFFNADPAIALADVDVSALIWQTAIGFIPVAAGDWFAPSGGALGAMAHVNTPMAFNSLENLYVAWFHELATSVGADEVLSANLYFRIEK